MEGVNVEVVATALPKLSWACSVTDRKRVVEGNSCEAEGNISWVAPPALTVSVWVIGLSVRPVELLTERVTGAPANVSLNQNTCVWAAAIVKLPAEVAQVLAV